MKQELQLSTEVPIGKGSGLSSYHSGVYLSGLSSQEYVCKKKGKVHPCAGTGALYRPYGP
jgi:hypothetical protein